MPSAAPSLGHPAHRQMLQGDRLVHASAALNGSGPEPVHKEPALSQA